MENVYLTALHGMPTLLTKMESPMESFKRNRYAEAFKHYYESNLTIYQAVEDGYNPAIDKEQFIENMAEELVSEAARRMDECKKKSKKEALIMEYNLCMVVYVLPGILKFQGNSSRPLADRLTASWKQHFPQTNISAASFEEIESGFHKKWCYITTAVCETFHKPDDCYELTLLRDYRDGYLMSQPDGEKMIHEYYDVAPTIVKRINQNADKKQIYEHIWRTYLHPCITMIETQKLEECKELYIKMVRDLQEEYFYNYES